MKSHAQVKYNMLPLVMLLKKEQFKDSPSFSSTAPSPSSLDGQVQPNDHKIPPDDLFQLFQRCRFRNCIHMLDLTF